MDRLLYGLKMIFDCEITSKLQYFFYKFRLELHVFATLQLTVQAACAAAYLDMYVPIYHASLCQSGGVSCWLKRILGWSELSLYWESLDEDLSRHHLQPHTPSQHGGNYSSSTPS